jgi:hypothetical protein
MEKYEAYFNEMVQENEEDILTICETASRSLNDDIKIPINDPRLIGCIFSITYDSIIKKLKEVESSGDWLDQEINIANRLLIGFSTNENDDDEKMGNFMVYLRDNKITHKRIEVDDPMAPSKERSVQWMTENIQHNPSLLKDIAISSIKALKEYDIHIQDEEIIWPIFCYTYDSIVNYLKIKRAENNDFEFEIYFMSCFYIGARESEDDLIEIYITPNIESKLTLKDDTLASSSKDD